MPFLLLFLFFGLGIFFSHLYNLKHDFSSHKLPRGPASFPVNQEKRHINLYLSAKFWILISTSLGQSFIESFVLMKVLEDKRSQDILARSLALFTEKTLVYGITFKASLFNCVYLCMYICIPIYIMISIVPSTLHLFLSYMCI